MTHANLARALAYIDEDEGPELNIAASEPGGSSKHGVSMEVLREWHALKHLAPPTMNDMRAIDSAKAGEIYTGLFANPIRFDELPSGVDYRVFDAEINAGRTGGVWVLEDALGRVRTGKMSDDLVKAANGADPAVLIPKIGAAWLAFKIHQSGGSTKYVPGWTNRLNRANARALAMIAGKRATEATKGNTMWKGIVGKSFTQAGFAEYVAGQNFGLWRPRFVVVHNTSAPDTKTWQGWQGRNPPITDERWMQNLVGYYRDEQRWSSGPHLFVTPGAINVFSPLTGPGTHSPSWNAISWGIETVGEFEHDPFTGSVRDNLIAALAILHAAAGLQPRPYDLGVRGLHFHKEDPKTTHRSCPGRNMVKTEVVSAVEAKIAAMNGGEHIPEVITPGPDEKKTGVVNAADGLSLRAGASSKAPLVKTLAKGTRVTITGETMNGSTKWYAVDNGFVAARYVDLT